MMRYGLTEETIDKINTVLASHPSVEKAVLFGSRAKGNFKPGSDIDLSLYGDTLTTKELDEISSKLDDLLLPYNIDLTIFNDLDHAKLRDHIERVGKVFYHRGRVVGCQGSAVKAGWKLSTLGSLCDILDSQRKPITKRDRTPGEYPYYGATGVQDYVQGYLFDEPLILVGEDGAKWASGENTAFAIKGKCWVNNHAHVLRPYRTVLMDNWLIHYFVHSDLSSFVSGLTVPKLNQGSLRGIPIPLPPLPEQQRIVGILDKAFDGIATAKANAEKNLQNARRLFQSSFVSILGTFNQRDWRIVTVAEVALPIKGSIRTGPFGSQLLHTEFVEEGIAVLGIDNAVNNEFRWGKKRFITLEKFKQLSRYQVKPGDVLITIMGTCGRCAIVPENIPTAINTKHLCCITLEPSKCLPDFLHAYFLYHPVAQDFLIKMAKGSIMAGLNMGIIQKLPLVLPPLEVQDTIVRDLKILYSETQRLESIYQQKLAALDTLKKSLLDQAFTGQL